MDDSRAEHFAAPALKQSVASTAPTKNAVGTRFPSMSTQKPAKSGLCCALLAFFCCCCPSGRSSPDTQPGLRESSVSKDSGSTDNSNLRQPLVE